MKLERVKRMLVKEFIHVFRDPKMKGVIFLMPIVQALVFGYAVTTDVRNVATAVMDLDNTPASRDLVARFENSGYFTITSWLTEESEVREVLDRGEVRAVLRLNSGFGGDLLAGRPARLQMLLDGTDSNTAGIVLDYSSRIAGEFSHAQLSGRNARMRGGAPPPAGVTLETRTWFNANLESRNFYVPGVIAILVMLITLMLTSMAVVREKEVGTMEQVMVTPITPAEFILGKSLPFALIGFADVIAITLIGRLWFNVPIRGDIGLLLLASAFFIMTTIGIGLLVSTVSQTQQQAMMGTFFLYFPAVLLSGFMFPIANMPAAIRWFTLANPLRHYLVIIRGIFLKGVGADILWPQLAALAAMGASVLWIATRRFRKTNM